MEDSLICLEGATISPAADVANLGKSKIIFKTNIEIRFNCPANCFETYFDKP
jgi:hypothetical protein